MSRMSPEEAAAADAGIKRIQDSLDADRTIASLREQLAATQAIARTMQALAIEVLGHFSPASVVGGQRKGDVVALVGKSQHAQWRKAAGLDAP